MIVDPNYKKDWDFTKRINELYETPVIEKKHDHNPANDAYTIGYDQQVLLNIRSGRVKMRKMYTSRNIGVQSLRLGTTLLTELKDFSVKQYQVCQSKRRQRNQDIQEKEE
jgi:hypothetical protein